MLGTHLLAMLTVAAVANPQSIDEYDKTQITRVVEFEGQYLPMIAEALAHPRMRGRRLDCYRVSVTRWEGAWRVYFAGHRAPRPTDTDTEIFVGHMPQNPNCPDIGFIFDPSGKIGKVYLSRE